MTNTHPAFFAKRDRFVLIKEDVVNLAALLANEVNVVVAEAIKMELTIFAREGNRLPVRHHLVEQTISGRYRKSDPVTLCRIDDIIGSRMAMGGMQKVGDKLFLMGGSSGFGAFHSLLIWRENHTNSSGFSVFAEPFSFGALVIFAYSTPFSLFTVLKRRPMVKT
jgi:hypothetical protein